MTGGLRPALIAAACAAVVACVDVPQAGQPPPRAKPNFDEAAKLNTELGIDYSRNGEYDRALDKLTRAVEQRPDYALAHTALAFVYAQKGDALHADEEYRRSLTLADDPATRNNYGVFLCEQKRYGDAERMFLQAASSAAYSTPEAAWANAGQCARRVPDLAKAEGYFRKALQVNPQFPDALSQMAWVSFQKKDYIRTRAFLQRYEKVGPVTPETLSIGARTETALGDKAAAAAYAARLREQFPEYDEKTSSSGTPSS